MFKCYLFINFVTYQNTTNTFLHFNSVITKICIAVRLAEDGARMGDMKFQLLRSIKYNQKRMLSNLTCVLIYSLTNCVDEGGFKDSCVMNIL